jgi:DNA replication and repair protein RecF
MPLTRLDISDFRNLASISVEPIAAGFNLLYGFNGSGKTNLLEAIYYLSLGRSFRSSTISRIVRNSAEKFLIFGHTSPHGEQSIPVGIERQLQGDIKIRIAGRDVQSAAELADITPVQLIHSYCFNLLDGGPVFRRKYLDWGVFYLNNDFLRVWREYEQVLKQRNAALRSQRPYKELIIWTEELAVKAAQLHHLRMDYVERLLPILTETVPELLTLQHLKMEYQAGWDSDLAYQDVLMTAMEKDSYLGYTQFGPHRADLKITINRVNAKDILSRGQQKLFVCAMLLAQGALLNRCMNKKPIYLIDDLPAELDSVSRTKLIALLSKQETQVFVTAVEREALSDALSMLPLKMFHVEHGSIKEAT